MSIDFMEKILSRLEDLERRQANLIRLGTVAAINATATKIKVKVTETLETPWIGFFERAAGEVKTSAPPSLNERVLLLNTSSGESLANAVALRGVTTSTMPPLAKGAHSVAIAMPDGSTGEYNHQTSTLSLHLSDTATVKIGGGATVQVGGDATLKIAGKAAVEVGGDLTADVAGIAKIDALMLHLNGGEFSAVTTASICHFTGAPHAHGSLTVKAAM